MVISNKILSKVNKLAISLSNEKVIELKQQQNTQKTTTKKPNKHTSKANKRTIVLQLYRETQFCMKA